MVLLFSAGFGFAVAGAVSSLHRLLTADGAGRLPNAGRGFSGNLAATLLIIVGGPFVMAEKALAGLRARRFSGAVAGIGLLAAFLWSVCAGLFYMSLMLAA